MVVAGWVRSPWRGRSRRVDFGGGHLPFEHGLLAAHTGGAQDDDDGEGKLKQR